MPTLLSINNYYYRRGGGDVVFLEQNRLFEEIGWEVLPFSMQHPSNYESKWSEYFVDEIEFGRPYSLVEKVSRLTKVLYSVEAQKNIGALIDKMQPQVAHIHILYHHISPSILPVLRKRGIPTVLTAHDLKLCCPAYKMLTHDGICERCKNNRTYNVVLHRCLKDSYALSSIVLIENLLHKVLGSYRKNVDRFIVPSRFYQDKMVEWGWARDKIVYIPNFVDVENIQPKYEVGKAFLYLGRLAPEKGLKTLIKAAALAKVPVWIAGTGPDEDVLHKLAEESGADVSFLGYRSGEDLYDLVRAARAVVLPSEWYENAPISLLESYAFGKPVIGAAIGGIPELIREKQTGATFESGSTESLAAILREFAELPDNRLVEMGRSGREWVESDFTPNKYRERLLRLYKEIGVAL